MKQLPGKKGEAVIRVQMDSAELHRLLDPILQEVNSLRERVSELEGILQGAKKGWAAHMVRIVEDDGR